jgi:fido (protein-threonine AMPylation protein)
MPLAPGYGETPLDPEESDALTARARELLGDDPTKADLYEAEQAVLAEVSEQLLDAVADGALGLEEILSDHFLRDVHLRLYGDIWTWAGRLRTRELNIGIAPEQIAATLRTSLENLRYRWDHTQDWTPREFGIAVHAETVRIHPFIDGNGRTTRLLADLVFLAAQDDELLESYDWALDKDRYIALLRTYDQTRDPRPLATFISVIPIA